MNDDYPVDEPPCELKSGPEMDAAVARALGHVIRTDSLGQYIILPRSVISRPPWKWSTYDACAVRDVLPEIERWGRWKAGSHNDGSKWFEVIRGDGMSFVANAPKLAHAICCAFLEAARFVAEHGKKEA